LASSGREFPIEVVLPPAALLTEEAYMVNSSFYHPESLVFAFPEKTFIGMPLDAARFEDFERSFPGFDTILWHDFGVQDELRQQLIGSGRFRIADTAINSHGRTYTVLVRNTSEPIERN
jgi:hypothetical protein